VQIIFDLRKAMLELEWWGPQGLHHFFAGDHPAGDR
jgi:hypothetical protein